MDTCKLLQKPVIVVMRRKSPIRYGTLSTSLLTDYSLIKFLEETESGIHEALFQEQVPGTDVVPVELPGLTFNLVTNAPAQNFHSDKFGSLPTQPGVPFTDWYENAPL